MITNLRTVAATIVITLVTCTPLFASETIELTDGNSLLRLCEAALNPNMSRSDLLARMYLMGYVRGFTAAHPSAAEYDIPPGVTVEQAVRIIKKWLEDHPKMLDKPAASLILLSLKNAYPERSR